jgi:glycine/betaine/sarcosine/D-proline reductase family selenoprotein B
MPLDDDALGFSPADDLPVRYIERTHAWYDAIGTDNRYRYATHRDVPFAPLRRPLSGCSVALLTTAAPHDPDKGPQGAGAPYNAAAKFYAVYSGDATLDHDLRISHVGIDRRQQTDDSACWFPLPALRRTAAAGRIGRVAPRFHGVPTNRSHRHTVEVDSPEVLRRLREDGADCAVLVANCPICHQTMALLARHLEGAGIPTVVMGAAKDIVEACGVPRFVFSDFPLGNAAARPHDPASQDSTLGLALRLLEAAFAPRTTVQNPLRWNGEADWKRHVMDVSSLTPERLEALRAEFRQSKAVSHAKRAADLAGRG